MRIRSDVYRRFIHKGLALALAVVPCAGTLADQRPDGETGARTVIGESNPDLAEGARRLLAGDAEEGIRLTRRGLDVAVGSRERQAGLSNLCAGYLQLKEYDVALDYCDAAIAVNPRNWRALCNRALAFVLLGEYDAAAVDLDLAETLAPNARPLRHVRALWRDATDPVVPTVVIDDRRDPEPAENVPGNGAEDERRQ